MTASLGQPCSSGNCARRLQTVMEKLPEEASFEADDRNGETVAIDEAYVAGKLGSLGRDSDLSKYIL